MADAVRFVPVGDARLVAADAARLIANDAEEVHYIHTDRLGTPHRMTDNAGAVIWDASFTPYGREDAITGPASLDIRFPGQVYDAETGLHYNTWRDYAPTSGRYVQSDPIGLAGGLNTYAYVEGNPVNAVDPDGLRATRCMMFPRSLGCPPRPEDRGGGRGGGSINAGDLLRAILNALGIAEQTPERPAEKSAGTLDGKVCGKDDDYCFNRWAQEDTRCWQWQSLGTRVVRACQDRAATRRDLCIRNGGKPDPNEPPEYNPFLDYPR